MRVTTTLAVLVSLALPFTTACGDDGGAGASDTVVAADVDTDKADGPGDATASDTTGTAPDADTGPDTTPTGRLTVTLSVPPETPADAAIVVVADAATATATDGPGGLTASASVPLGALSWHVELRPTADTKLVELDASGQPVSRALTVTGDHTASADVARWGPAGGVTGSEVAFIATIPAGSDTATGIWISGDAAALGTWSGAGVRLAATRDGRWAAVVALPDATTVAYKFTRGAWATVEKDATGAEIENRTWAVSGPFGRAEATVARWADQGGTGPHTGTGEIDVLEGVSSAFLEADRDVLVWLPPGYDTDTAATYPVLYMHDGQNLMDAATSAFGTEWGVDEAAQALVNDGAMEPTIIVGVGNSADRMWEYTPSEDASVGTGGGADAYGRFLVEELKPLIDASYRTRPEASATGLAGSSLGGLVSLYLGLEHPDTFTRLGVISPSVWWDGRDIITHVQALTSKPPLRIWVDIGTAEGSGETVEDTRLLRDALVTEGWVVGQDLAYTEVPGAAHNEAAWAARIDDILSWLFPPQ